MFYCGKKPCSYLLCRSGSSEETPPYEPHSWILQMSQVFWGNNYGESLIHFISSVSQEHFRVTYACKAAWPWVQVQLCSPTVPLSSSWALPWRAEAGAGVGGKWAEVFPSAMGMPWKWGTGRCCSHGCKCCQNHNGRLFWVNCSSKKYNWRFFIKLIVVAEQKHEGSVLWLIHFSGEFVGL